jgi:putative endonuclease
MLFPHKGGPLWGSNPPTLSPRSGLTKYHDPNTAPIARARRARPQVEIASRATNVTPAQAETQCTDQQGDVSGSMPKQPCVSILASKRNGTIYIGVTSDSFDRVVIHKQDLIEGFTKRYGVRRVVYYEMHQTMNAAIRREKRLKKWNRAWKLRLIESVKSGVGGPVRRVLGCSQRRAR